MYIVGRAATTVVEQHPVGLVLATPTRSFSTPHIGHH